MLPASTRAGVARPGAGGRERPLGEAALLATSFLSRRHSVGPGRASGGMLPGEETPFPLALRVSAISFFLAEPIPGTTGSNTDIPGDAEAGRSRTVVAAIALLLTVVVAAAAGWWCRSRCPRRGYAGTRPGGGRTRSWLAFVYLVGIGVCLPQDVYKLCEEVVSF